MDAHSRAFAAFGVVPKRVIYDNLKTVVDAIFVGKERQFNRRFLALANHYWFEPKNPVGRKAKLRTKLVMSENGYLHPLLSLLILLNSMLG